MSPVSFARSSSPFVLSRSLITRLFDGMELSAEQEAQALEIVAETIASRLEVTLRSADGWSRLTQLNLARDTALRALLTSDTDRAEFDARVAELQRQEAQARPMTGTVPVVLRVSTTPTSGGTLEIVYRADGMADEATEAAAWQIVRAFRADAEQMGLRRITTIADILERREEFATYSRSVLRSFGRQPDRSWAALPAV